MKMKHEKIVESIRGLSETVDALENVVGSFFNLPHASREDEDKGGLSEITLDDVLTETPEDLLKMKNRIIKVIEDLHALTIAPEENKKA